MRGRRDVSWDEVNEVVDLTRRTAADVRIEAGRKSDTADKLEEVADRLETLVLRLREERGGA